MPDRTACGGYSNTHPGQAPSTRMSARIRPLEERTLRHVLFIMFTGLGLLTAALAAGKHSFESDILPRFEGSCVSSRGHRATALHFSGRDHETLTCRFQGCHLRPTGVSDRVIAKLPA